MEHKDNYNTYAYINSTTDHTYATCYPHGLPGNDAKTGGTHAAPSSGNSHEMIAMSQDANKENGITGANRKSNEYNLTPHNNNEDTVPGIDVKVTEGQTSSDDVDAESADSDGDPNASYAVLNKETLVETDYQYLKTDNNDDIRDKNDKETVFTEESPYHVLDGPTPPSPPKSPMPTLRRNNAESEDDPYDVLNEPLLSLEQREMVISSQTNNPTDKDETDQMGSEQNAEESPYNVLEGPTPPSPPNSPVSMLQGINNPESEDIPYDVLDRPLLSVKPMEMVTTSQTDSPTVKDETDQIECEQNTEESPYNVLEGPTPPSPPNSPVPMLQGINNQESEDFPYDVLDRPLLSVKPRELVNTSQADSPTVKLKDATDEIESEQIVKESPYHVLDEPTPPSPPNSPIPSLQRNIEPTIVDSYANDDDYDLVDSNAMLITAEAESGQSCMEKNQVLTGDDANSNQTDNADPEYETVDKVRRNDLPKSTVASNILMSNVNTAYDDGYDRPRIPAVRAKIDSIDSEASDDTYL